MKTEQELFAAVEEQRHRRQFMSMPLEKRVRNTCPGCGCRLVEDFEKAVVFVNGPEKRGQCQKCGWVGTK